MSYDDGKCVECRLIGEYANPSESCRDMCLHCLSALSESCSDFKLCRGVGKNINHGNSFCYRCKAACDIWARVSTCDSCIEKYSRELSTDEEPLNECSNDEINDENGGDEVDSDENSD